MRLTFKVHTDTPVPFQVLWKVRNRGAAAAQAGDLRGQLFDDDARSPLIHHERTRYPGRHFVEVYIVKNRIVVASDHHDVIIE
jgi:hypothetical protein